MDHVTQTPSVVMKVMISLDLFIYISLEEKAEIVGKRDYIQREDSALNHTSICKYVKVLTIMMKCFGENASL